MKTEIFLMNNEKEIEQKEKELQDANNLLKLNIRDAEDRLMSNNKQLEAYKFKVEKLNEKLTNIVNENEKNLKEKDDELINLTLKNTTLSKYLNKK